MSLYLQLHDLEGNRTVQHTATGIDAKMQKNGTELQENGTEKELIEPKTNKKMRHQTQNKKQILKTIIHICIIDNNYMSQNKN